jgi:hypothetical protein
MEMLKVMVNASKVLKLFLRSPKAITRYADVGIIRQAWPCHGQAFRNEHL